MTHVLKEEWVSCSAPAVLDTIRWREPLWDKPNKPRGKPDKIGEQMVTAKLMTMGELVELQVIDVKRLSLMKGAQDEPSKIKKDDMIRRKAASIKSGGCEKLLQEG
jgi:hypothetical protein